MFVPTGQPWQKDRHVTAAEDRYPDDRHRHRVQPPVLGEPRRHRPGGADLHHRHPARAPRGLHPDADLYFITGADALGSILTWQGAEGLFGLARFVGVSRPGYELTDAHITEAFHRLPDDALHLVEVPALAISSTDCRERAAVGRPIWYLVPDGVVQYVAKRDLYRACP